MRGTTTSFVCALFMFVACGTPPRPPGGGGDDSDANMGSNGSGSNGDNCSADAKLVYVVDENYQLSQFDPIAKSFHDLGPLNCQAKFGATPFSMGIDRNATAWVLYSSGELFRVDTTTLNCTKTPWASQAGLMQYGMGFSTDVAGGTADTLFVCGGTGGPSSPTSQLAKLSTTGFTAQPVGPVTGWPELTGTGNAELWGFFPDANNPRMARLDKGNGSAAATFPLPTLKGMPTAWAFAFYGGDYYVFLSKDSETFTTVYQVSNTGQIKGSTPTVGRKIVGAGVSTCAPVIIQ